MVDGLIKLLTRHLEDHPYFIPTPLIHLDRYEIATTSTAKYRQSTNKLILTTASSTAPIIFPPNSIDTTSTSPTTYPSYILIPLSAPSTPPSGFSPRLPPDSPFDTPQGAHILNPSGSSRLTLPPGRNNSASSYKPSNPASGDTSPLLPKQTSE